MGYEGDSEGLPARIVRAALPVALTRLGLAAFFVTDMMAVGQFAPRQFAWTALGWVIVMPLLVAGSGLLFPVRLLCVRAVDGDLYVVSGEIWRKGLMIALFAGLAASVLVWVAAEPILAVAGVPAPLVVPAASIARLLSLALPFHFASIASMNFLDAVGKPGPVAFALLLANAVNVFANFWLVPQSGAIGSAWATVLSRVALFVLIAVYIADNRGLKPYLANWSGAGRMMTSSMLRMGTIATAPSALEAVAFSFLGVLAARAGAADVSLFHIALFGLVAPAFALAAGLSTAGLRLGVEMRDGADATWMAIGLCGLAAAACAAALYGLRYDVAARLSTDGDIRAALAALMTLIAVLVVVDAMQGSSDAVLRARGAPRFAIAARLAAFVVAAPVAAYWLVEREQQGVAGVLEALIAASALAGLVFLIRLLFAGRAAPD